MKYFFHEAAKHRMALCQHYKKCRSLVERKRFRIKKSWSKTIDLSFYVQKILMYMWVK